MSFVASSSFQVHKVFNISKMLILSLVRRKEGLAKSKKDETETLDVIGRYGTATRAIGFKAITLEVGRE